MSDSVVSGIQALCEMAKKLSIVGASLKLRSRQDVDQPFRKHVMVGSEAALGLSLEALSDEQALTLFRTVEMTIAETVELVRNPERVGGWKVEDAHLLQAQGQASRQAFRHILDLSKTRPLLAATLQKRFLDVGTGVAGIALEAAMMCPSLTVDGIDIWELALELARRNVAASPCRERVNVWRCDVSDLELERRYSLVWLPTMFMKTMVVERALGRIAAASLNGAYVVAATYTRPSDPFGASFAALRTLRSGGDLMEASSLERMLRGHSYVDVESDITPIATFTLGRLVRN